MEKFISFSDSKGVRTIFNAAATGCQEQSLYVMWPRLYLASSLTARVRQVLYIYVEIAF